MSYRRLAVLGCGLMGGSFALALRAAGLVHQVAGYSASASTRQRALQLGVIDHDCPDVATAVDGADLVLVSVPVQATAATLAAVAPVLDPRALLMDVGSTKRDVVAAARATLGAALPRFVPAHPIAGKELSGIEHAEASLYRDRPLILTPLPENPDTLVEQAADLWRQLGSQVHRCDPDAHDASLAAVSHLPHVLAFAAVNAVARQTDGAAHLALAGPGFRDFSRIAASDPTVWRDILLANREQVLHQAALLRASLSQFEHAIQGADGDALLALIGEARQTRSSWQLCGNTPRAPSAVAGTDTPHATPAPDPAQMG